MTLKKALTRPQSSHLYKKTDQKASRSPQLSGKLPHDLTSPRPHQEQKLGPESGLKLEASRTCHTYSAIVKASSKFFCRCVGLRAL